jgi:hypothetical protein
MYRARDDTTVDLYELRILSPFYCDIDLSEIVLELKSVKYYKLADGI